MKNTIKKIIFETYNKQNYNKKFVYHTKLLELFNYPKNEFGNIDEGEDITKTKDVISKILNDDWEKFDPAKFKRAMEKSQHKKMLSDYSIQEIGKMKLFKLNGYDIGFALKKWEDGTYSEIVLVFNNEPNVKGIGKELIKSAIKKGGCYLDHFDGFLSNLYSNLGFIEYKRDKFNPEYDVGGQFEKKYGRQDIIYRIHKNCLK